MLDLTKDVKYVKGVGPNRVKLLNKIFKLKISIKDIENNDIKKEQ